MKFNKLGDTNLDVSSICLGTMTFGEQNNQKESFEIMDYATEKGINFFDTAEQYSAPCTKDSYGRTETIIGNWFIKKNNREKIILATKISGPGKQWIRGGNLQYTEKNITLAIENSLKRLKTDYIDLYQLHWPERNTNYSKKLVYNFNDNDRPWNDIKSILLVLKKFIDQGKIRYIGICNETSWGLLKFLELSKLYNLPRIVSIQNPYNLLNRSYESDLAEISIREKSGLLAYSPLAFGVLTGKYRNYQEPNGSRLKLFKDYFASYSGKLSTAATEEYFQISKKYNISLTQLSLAFINRQPFVTSSIIGATTINQLKENIESLNINLKYEIIDEINLIYKNNPNPTSFQESRKLIYRMPSYLITAVKLLLKGKWNYLGNKIKKILKYKNNLN